MISTILLIGVRPMALSLFLSHSGDSPTVKSLITKPQYLGVFFASATLIFNLTDLLLILKSSTGGVISSRLTPF